MSVGLTPKQREVLAYLRERETPPTYREIMKACRLKSTGQVYNRLQSLAERGHIIRRFDRNGNLISRSIEVVEPVIINGNRYRFIPKTRAG